MRRFGYVSPLTCVLGVVLVAQAANPQAAAEARKAFEANQQVVTDLKLADQVYVPIMLRLPGAQVRLPVLICNCDLADEQMEQLNASADKALGAVKAEYAAGPARLCVAAQYVVSAMKYPVKDLHTSVVEAGRECQAAFESNKDERSEVAADAARRYDMYASAARALETYFEQGVGELTLVGCGLVATDNPWPNVYQDVPAEITLADAGSKTVNWPVLAAFVTAHLAQQPDASGPATKWLLTALYQSKCFFSTGRAGILLDDVARAVGGLLPALAQPMAASALDEAAARPIGLPATWEMLGIDAAPALPSDERLRRPRPLEQDLARPEEVPGETPAWAAFRRNHDLVAQLGLKAPDFARVVLPSGVVLCAPYAGSDAEAAEVNKAAAEAYRALSEEDEWTALAAGQYLLTVEERSPESVLALFPSAMEQGEETGEALGPSLLPPGEGYLRVTAIMRDAQGRAMVVLPAAPGQEGQVLEVGDRWEGFRVEEVTTTEMVLAKQEGGQVVRKVLRLQVGGARRPKGTDRGSGDGAPAIPQKRVTLPYVGEKALVDAARRCFALGETTMRVVTLGGLTVPTPRGWEEQPEARAAALQEACSLAETASKDETTGCRAAYALRLAAFLDPSSETFESLRWHIRQVLASARIFGVRSAAEGAPVYLDPVERVTHFVSSFSDSRLGDRIGELAREIGQEALSFPPTPEELKARPK